MRIVRRLRVFFDGIVIYTTPSCEQIVREASEEAGGVPLSGFRRFYIEMHMMCCALCDNYIKNVRSMGRALRRLTGRLHEDSVEDPTPLGPGLSEAARTRLIAYLKDHDLR